MEVGLATSHFGQYLLHRYAAIPDQKLDQSSPTFVAKLKRILKRVENPEHDPIFRSWVASYEKNYEVKGPYDLGLHFRIAVAEKPNWSITIKNHSDILIYPNVEKSARSNHRDRKMAIYARWAKELAMQRLRIGSAA